MGTYDSVWMKCPRCDDKVEFQSKAGKCILEHFTMEDVPRNVAQDILGQTTICEKCELAITICGDFHMWASYTRDEILKPDEDYVKGDKK